MNQIKRLAGIIWIILGPLAVFYLVKTASDEIIKKPVMDTWIQWGVFVLVAIPIAAGMVIFGYYALQGAYDSKAEYSDELIH
jgi:hypothetical protein